MGVWGGGRPIVEVQVDDDLFLSRGNRGGRDQNDGEEEEGEELDTESGEHGESRSKRWMCCEEEVVEERRERARKACRIGSS